jgi:hypothetical protein
LKLTVHVIIFPEMLFRFQSYNVFSFRGSAGSSGCWVHMQSLGEERNSYRCSLLWLVQYGTRDKSPLFCCKISSWLFWISGSCLCLSSTQQFSRLPVLAITCDKPGSADAWITIREIRHWLMQCKRIWWRVCYAKNKVERTKVKCQECNIGLCATPCFKIYHTKLHFWGANDTKIEKRNTQM